MRGLLLRHVLGRYLVLVGAVLAGLLVVFLVADFVDRARAYTGPNWVRDVLELYGWKALVATHQLAPAALLLASATLVSLLRRKGELTAILALGFGRRVLFLPVAAVALVTALVLGLMDEFVVGHASRRVDEITALRFHRWGDWRSFYERKQWFRHQDRILHLESGDVESGFRGVTVLRITPDFELAERVDATGMEHAGGTRWHLVGVTRRVFDRRGGLKLTTLAEETVDLGIPRSLLGIRPGRPEQMRLPVLRQQIRARREVGLPDRLFLLALGNRFAYPLAGVPAALLAVALALRPRGRGTSLTGALVEGLALTMGLWGLTVIGRALVNAGRIAPLLAAALPILALTVALAALLWIPPGWARRFLRRRGWSGAPA